MSDPATPVQRVQRRLRRHLYRHPRSPLSALAPLVLDTRARLERSCGNPRCPCADEEPACPEYMDGYGADSELIGRCVRCGNWPEHHPPQPAGTRPGWSLRERRGRR